MVTSKNKFKILMHFHYLFIVLPYTKMNQIDRSRVFWSSTALENIGESLRYSDWFLSFVCFYYIHSVFFVRELYESCILEAWTWLLRPFPWLWCLFDATIMLTVLIKKVTVYEAYDHGHASRTQLRWSFDWKEFYNLMSKKI